jgi:hypothetical protein
MIGSKRPAVASGEFQGSAADPNIAAGGVLRAAGAAV